ncbi:hypothetical protein K3495_g6289 [Podosphaera aphanis]|nr:hypothetical protein K3495_g6289 [Podosphaera aphanis]
MLSVKSNDLLIVLDENAAAAATADDSVDSNSNYV